MPETAILLYIRRGFVKIHTHICLKIGQDMAEISDRFIEFLSAFTCVISIWFNTKRNVLGWPIGIVSILLAAWVYWQSNLYAELGLQVFFFVSGFWGWWQWSQKKNAEGTVEIEPIPTSSIGLGLGLSILFSFLIYNVLKLIPGASFPFADAIITSFSLLGQYWLSKRWTENWLVWIGVNVLSFGVYIQKELWFFVVLYAILTFLAVRGYHLWKSRKVYYA